MGGSMVIKGGFLRIKKARWESKVGGGDCIANTATRRRGANAGLRISIGVFVWFGFGPCRIAGAPCTSNHSSAPLTVPVISSFRRECHKMCCTWSVLQLPADYISRISILKGRLLEHTDNVWVLKIISPLIINGRHWALGKEMSINTRKALLCK